MDEIEFLIFRKLVETDQLEHIVRGWTVWLEFPEIGLKVMYDRNQAMFVWGMAYKGLADGVKVEKIEQLDCSQKEVS